MCCECMQVPKEDRGIGSPGSKVTGGYEMPDVCSGDQI